MTDDTDQLEIPFVEVEDEPEPEPSLEELLAADIDAFAAECAAREGFVVDEATGDWVVPGAPVDEKARLNRLEGRAWKLVEEAQAIRAELAKLVEEKAHPWNLKPVRQRCRKAEQKVRKAWDAVIEAAGGEDEYRRIVEESLTG
jgi:hypothetical protein